MILDVDYLHNKQETIELIEKQRYSYDNFAISQFKKALLKSYERALFEVENCATIEQLSAINSAPDYNAIKQAYNNVYQKVGGDFAKKTYNAVKPLAKAKDDGLTEEWQKQMERFLDAYGATRVVAVADQTGVRFKQEVNKVIKDGVARGLSIDDIKRNLVSNIEGMSSIRARTIARTEVVGASNQGSLIGAQSSGLMLDKVWLTAHNKVPPRPTHKAADGQTVSMYEKFKVGTEEMNAPGDVTASPEEVINCRCTIIYKKRL